VLPRTYLPYYDIEDPQQVEDFHRRLLLLFKPWRQESFLKDDHQTFKEAYNEFLNSLSQSAREDIEKYV